MVEIVDLQAHNVSRRDVLWACRSAISTIHDYHDYDKIIAIMSNNWRLDDYVIIVTGLVLSDSRELDRWNGWVVDWLMIDWQMLVVCCSFSCGHQKTREMRERPEKGKTNGIALLIHLHSYLKHRQLIYIPLHSISPSLFCMTSSLNCSRPTSLPLSVHCEVTG